jgi:serine-type D-Ala-D-Ala carboxypeptidase/endopeptidase
MTATLRRCIGVSCFVVLSFLMPALASGQQQFPSAPALELMLRYLVEDGETTGIVLGVLEADGSTQVVGYGESGLDAYSLGANSIFDIGSVTKVFTGTLLAQMVESREVALADPVSKYLPGRVKVPSFNGLDITLLDLATHTSGLSGLPRPPLTDLSGLTSGVTLEVLYDVLSRYDLVQEPGTAYSYSNVGMGLLAHALSRAADKPLSELMSERILYPLGMNSTGFAPTDALQGRTVRGHVGALVEPAMSLTETDRGAGGLWSTAEDLLTFLRANVGPASTDLERAMRTAHEPRRPAGDGERQIGLAWQVYSLRGHTIYRHTGLSGGFKAEIAFDPDRQIGVVSLSNSRDYGENLVTDLLVREPLEDTPEFEVRPALLVPYAGTYTSDGGLPFHIRMEAEGHLTAQARAQTRFRLYATSDSTFSAKRVPFGMTFHRDIDGAVSHLVLEVFGRTNRFERMTDDSPAPVIVAQNNVREITAAELAVYSGTYLTVLAGQQVEIRVFGEEGRLLADIAGQRLAQLFPVGEHEFSARAIGARIIFEVEAGKAQRLTATGGGLTYVGIRRR